ncbi:MAG: MoaD/ThiS family protein [Acidobacteria bacterium]|nr:MoaD/ThiS family protein [Acidobacteriota bacterium]
MMTNTMTGQLTVHVLFFGACREIVQADEIVCELTAPATVTAAWEAVKTRCPALAAFERSALFAVNEEHAPRTQSLQTGDVLAIFPPVSGG